ncbi:MAG: PfkB family carbohydrate kinase [Chitinophagales bacterium]|nr:PfkB family carbohydrate kinase [Chitinophagales bacterium]MDW8393561.1 PfkB family carbohydrate kinase [Chitinophagales bacterium]
MSILDVLQRGHHDSGSSILVVGTLAFDSIETPFGSADRILGGTGLYISLAASYFTRNIRLVSVVGNDFPLHELSRLNERGIHTEGVQVKTTQKSFFWKGRYHLDMNTRDTLVTELNVLADFDPIIPESYQDSQFLMLGNLTPAVQISVIRRLRQRPRLIVMDTMNYWMRNTPRELAEALRLVDVLVINDEEAREFSGEYSLIKAARKVLNSGPKYLVIKKGEHGALLFYDNNVFFAPALPLEDVFDPTGAGDTFAGGFTGYLAKTQDISFDNMKRAVIYGSAMASFCVAKFGAEQLTQLTPDDIEERVNDFVDLVQFDISLVD